MSGRPRKQLPMSDEEIRREYRLAKDPKKQLKILADENDCSVSTIRSIVSADQPRGTLPSQEPAEKEAEKEKDGVEENDFSPLPSAPPQAAADFDELGPSSLPDVQDIPEASAAAGTEERIATAPAGPHPAGEGSPLGTPALPRNDGAGEESAAPGMTSPPLRGSPPLEGRQEAAEESGNIYRISGKDLSWMWHILGRLQGVLEASAEAGKPGEVMKDACDELEVLLRGIQQDAG